MDSKILFALLLLPGLAQAVICKTVGPDGVTSFSDVPAAECPQGSAIPDQSQPKPLAEQAGSVSSGGITGRQIPFTGYESINIQSPTDGGTVRSNDGSVPVLVELDPGLLQNHFITAYVDGKAFRGRYGSSVIELTRVDRGIHKLRVKVSDSSGKTLVESGVITFTLQKVGSSLTVNPITGDNYVDQHDPALVKIRGLYKGPDEEDTLVSLWFPVRGKETRSVRVTETKTEESTVVTMDGRQMQVNEIYNWEIRVPRRYLETDASFEARARLARATGDKVNLLEDRRLRPSEDAGGSIKARMTSTHSVAPGLSSGYRAYEPSSDGPDYSLPPADYTPQTGGSSAAPGTNPAFKPNYGTR
jgi:hypothetical protein